jgi:hypothetical protein
VCAHRTPGALPRGCRGLGRDASVGSSTAEAEAMLVDWPRIRVIGDDIRRATWNAVDN